MSVRLLIGDCREVLKTLPDESVHCVVTSPPYFGLRDYGTAKWEGGDEACGHIERIPSRGMSTLTSAGIGQTDEGAAYLAQKRQFRDECGHCGARRIDSQIGLEPTVDAYVAEMVAVFREVRRVLRRDGVCFLNLGDSYATGAGSGRSMGSKVFGKSNAVIDAGSYPVNQANRMPLPGLKPKDLIGIPWAVAFALRADGWWLRQDVIWAKPNPMPESVTDRCTKAHEYLFLLTKSATYWYDAEAIAEPVSREFWNESVGPKYMTPQDGRMDGGKREGNGPMDGTRNKRSVWTVPSQPFSEWGETVHRHRVAWDAPDDDKKRITSPDCPLHGDHHLPVARVADDEREAGSAIHNGRSDDHHAPAQSDGSFPIDRHREREIEQPNSDCLVPQYSASAIGRSTQNYRTDLFLETSPAYTASVQTESHTLGTSASPGFSGSDGRTPESNNVGVGLADNPASQTAAYTAGISNGSASFEALHGSNCTCEWYIEKTEKTSHFATFPPALIEPCIKAGCPEKACARCGAPWVRQTDGATYYEGDDGTRDRKSNQIGDGHGGRGRGPKNNLGSSIRKTLGFAPSCACNADTVPGVCLDPFGGAGTTGLVADRLGRNAILIELNPTYAEMGRNRIVDDGPLFAQLEMAL